MLRCHESRKDVLLFLEKAVTLNAKRSKLQVCTYSSYAHSSSARYNFVFAYLVCTVVPLFVIVATIKMKIVCNTIATYVGMSDCMNFLTSRLFSLKHHDFRLYSIICIPQHKHS